MKKRQSQNIADLIQELDGGRFAEGASEELHRLLVSQRRRADDAGSTVKGELTLTIKLETEPGGSTKFIATVKSKRPGPPGAAMACVIDDHGSLTQIAAEPAKQGDLPFSHEGN